MLKIKKLLKGAKLGYYSVSSIAFITKSNPKQAIDLTIAHTKFGIDMSNIFPYNAQKQKKYTKVAN